MWVIGWLFVTQIFVSNTNTHPLLASLAESQHPAFLTTTKPTEEAPPEAGGARQAAGFGPVAGPILEAEDVLAASEPFTREHFERISTGPIGTPLRN